MMKWFLMFIIAFSAIACKYEEPKAKYSIIEIDTIAIDKSVLQSNLKEENEHFVSE